MTKGQEALEELGNLTLYQDQDGSHKIKDRLDYKVIEKELEAFSILKEAFHCNMFYISWNEWKLDNEKIMYMILPGNENFKFIITKKEFELLKEVLQ